MGKIVILMCFCALTSCLRDNSTNNTHQISPNTSLTLMHTGQTQLTVEYRKIFISAAGSFIQTSKKKYSFSIKEKELQSLYSQIRNAQVKSNDNSAKETTVIIESNHNVERKINSLYNLEGFVSLIENFVDRKIALPFRLPLVAPEDLVIEMDYRDDLFSEYGQYMRFLLGEGHVSSIENGRKTLHRFDISQEDLQYFVDILREQNFMWMRDSEEYARAKTTITWGKNRLEKDVVVPNLHTYVQRMKNLKSFPDIEKIPDNLQIEVLSETSNPITRKEIYISATAGYWFILDANGNSVQYQLNTTPRVIYRLLSVIKNNQELGNAATVTVTWDDSRVEREITGQSLRNIENKMRKLLQKDG